MNYGGKQEIVLGPYEPQNISTATTTVVKDGAGILHLITINGGTLGAITVYDNNAGSGTKIATLDASADRRSYFYNVRFTTGLTIVTAAATDITVAFL